MKKKLNITAISNELQGASVFFQPNKTQSTALSTAQSVDQTTNQPANQPVSQPSNKPIEQPTPQPNNQPTQQVIDQSNHRQIEPSVNQRASQPNNSTIDSSNILGRPKSFYITEKQDTELDVTVKHLTEVVQGKVNQKIDRSTVIRLLLEEADLTKKKTAERLASRLISQLISQLTG